jgi:hypothetical protein
LVEKTSDGGGPLLGPFQVIQAKVQERLAGFGFATRMFEEFCQIWKSQRNANTWECPILSHVRFWTSTITRKSGTALILGTSPSDTAPVLTANAITGDSGW